MAVYNNFLNTPYDSKQTLLLGTLANYEEKNPPPKAFIVYCDPKIVKYNDILLLINSPTKFSFRGQTVFNNQINLIDMFNSLRTYVNQNVSAFTRETDSITIQKFFYPYYQSLIYQTVFSNVITLDDFLTQMNIYYGNDVTFADILNLTTATTTEVNIIVNYDLFCPYYKFPIRFVFQNIVTIPASQISA